MKTSEANVITAEERDMARDLIAAAERLIALNPDREFALSIVIRDLRETYGLREPSHAG